MLAFAQLELPKGSDIFHQHTMDLYKRYQDTLAENGYSADGAQTAAIKVLQRVATELQQRSATASWANRIARRFIRQPARPPARGAYLWGGVGRGKTFMMDVFFDHLPFKDKQRFHFHRLMYRVHGQLKKLAASSDPLQIVADDIANSTRVICFDEFFVSDIADAMILGRLLSALFDRGVTLVATSNIPPADLYAGGLQRQQFLPAIDLLTRYTEIVHVDGESDYRLRVLEKAEIYHAPLDEQATQNLHEYFEQIAPDIGTRGKDIEVLGRNIATQRRADGIAWFSFGALCDGPRSQDDYIEIARCFQTVIVSDVPALDQTKENQARRFIALVDEFYDRRVKLIISAVVGIDQLYSGPRLAHEFQRTRSRLREMQSKEYLATAHLP